MGDQSFNWDNIQARFKRLETLHANLPAGVESKYTSPKSENHGGSGKLQVGYAAEWEKDVSPMLDMFEEAGFPMNPDHNSGNPIGMALSINSAHNGRRSTASDLLAPKPENLTIITDSPVQRVIFEGRRAVGIETNGKTCEFKTSSEVFDLSNIMLARLGFERGYSFRGGFKYAKDSDALWPWATATARKIWHFRH